MCAFTTKYQYFIMNFAFKNIKFMQNQVKDIKLYKSEVYLRLLPQAWATMDTSASF